MIIKRTKLCALLLLMIGLTGAKAQIDSLPGTLIDIDGNVYNTIILGDQMWMAENLRTTRYSNGDTIGTTSPDTLDYSHEDTPKYQWAYDGDESNVLIYGRLYTWYTVTDDRNICPDGWHVPTNAEWTILINYLGGERTASSKLKESGTKHWKSPNADASNESGFTALPEGSHWFNGEFAQMGEFGHYWAADEQYPGWPWRILFRFDDSIDNQRGSSSPKFGWSVRCVKD